MPKTGTESRLTMNSRSSTILALILALVASAFAVLPAAAANDKPVVLVWGGSYGFRHPSITQGEAAFTQLGLETGKFTTIVTENPADLNKTMLEQIDAIAWISTTGKPPFTEQQRKDIIRFAGCGGGTLAFHAAADSNYGWPEYAELLGAQFDSHPKNAGSGAARVKIERPENPILSGWKGASSFKLDDEYYRWRGAQGLPGISLPRDLPGTNVLLSLDERTVGGGIQKGATPYEDDQPIAWTKTFRGRGRVHYNNMGHSDATWSEPEFRTSLVKGVNWVTQKRLDLKCFNGTSPLPAKQQPPVIRKEAAIVGEPCPMPKIPQRSGYTWQQSGRMKRLTLAGDRMVMPSAGLPGGLAWGAQFYRLDLSTWGARSADVILELNIPNPIDDYDLSVTTGWGWYGSQKAQGTSTERVVIRNAPHCGILQVYGDNLYGISGQAPELTAKVVRRAKSPSSTPVANVPAPEGAANVVTAPPEATAVGFAPPLVAVPKGGSLTFVNADTMTHDITSVGRKDGAPLFKAAFTGSTGTAQVKGVEKLGAGTYPFFCSLHTNMKGTLVVQ